MLYPSKVLAALKQKQQHFQGFDADFGKQISAYREALRQLGQRYPTGADITARLATRADGAPAGALPTQEYDRWHSLTTHASAGHEPVLAFGERFAHHQQARTGSCPALACVVRLCQRSYSW